MKLKDGHVVTGQQEIADVFAEFYEELFTGRADINTSNPLGSMNTVKSHDVSDVTAEEVDDQLKKMSRRKACDSSGMAVELLKDGGRYLREVLGSIFSDMLRPDAITPQY
jgi:hypothetical protein